MVGFVQFKNVWIHEFLYRERLQDWQNGLSIPDRSIPKDSIELYFPFSESCAILYEFWNLELISAI
jgi:hypothetical protein